MKTLLGSMDGKGPAEPLHEAAELLSEQSWTNVKMVARARSAGLSYETIALCLGVSKRTVHKK